LKKNGVSLVDIIVAMAIFFMVFSITMTVCAQIYRLRAKNANEISALAYAKKTIEDLKVTAAITASDWSLIPNSNFYKKIELTQISSGSCILYTARVTVFGQCTSAADLSNPSRMNSLLGLGSARVTLVEQIASGYSK